MQGITALCEGAHMGNLDQEEQVHFTVSNDCDLQSPFLCGLLADESDADAQLKGPVASSYRQAGTPTVRVSVALTVNWDLF